jgi:septal ring factor EnvC (AmiA/AmiB activator)
VQAAQDKVARLNEELRRAMAERDQLAAVSTAASADRDRAEAAYAPARNALTAAEADLADVQRLEDERMRTLAQAGDVAVLLAALERLGK